jgi:hypothetical protein
VCTVASADEKRLAVARDPSTHAALFTKYSLEHTDPSLATGRVWETLHMINQRHGNPLHLLHVLHIVRRARVYEWAQVIGECLDLVERVNIAGDVSAAWESEQAATVWRGIALYNMCRIAGLPYETLLPSGDVETSADGCDDRFNIPEDPASNLVPCRRALAPAAYKAALAEKLIQHKKLAGGVKFKPNDSNEVIVTRMARSWLGTVPLRLYRTGPNHTERRYVCGPDEGTDEWKTLVFVFARWHQATCRDGDCRRQRAYYASYYEFAHEMAWEEEEDCEMEIEEIMEKVGQERRGDSERTRAARKRAAKVNDVGLAGPSIESDPPDWTSANTPARRRFRTGRTVAPGGH